VQRVCCPLYYSGCSCCREKGSSLTVFYMNFGDSINLVYLVEFKAQVGYLHLLLGLRVVDDQLQNEVLLLLWDDLLGDALDYFLQRHHAALLQGGREKVAKTEADKEEKKKVLKNGT
jgi:hypothetical protein